MGTRDEAEHIRVFLCGDVMTGRGIDQILPHPGNPVLYESYVRDAREYVRLAENVSGPTPRPADFSYIWGDAAQELQRARPDVRIINLETSITSSEEAWPDKGINYRMHPLNMGCLTAFGIDCCALSNNHVLDWGYRGLAETLQALDTAGIAHAGAGHNASEATSPAIIDVPGKGRVLIFSMGATTSGIPREWGATPDQPGVDLLEDLSEATAERVARRMQQARRPGDVIVASIHWGPNWGYAIPDSHRRFAHRLVDGGVDLVHGHSSHHVLASEIYRDRLILYGCGDFVDDYEGISGYEEFRPDLRLMYLVQVEREQARLVEVRLIVVQMRQFRLHRASEADVMWMFSLLNQIGAPFGTHVRLEPDHSLTLRRSCHT